MRGHNMRAGFVIAIATLTLPLGNMAATKHQKQKSQDEGVAQAIAFERAKDAADARQARIEAKQPTVFHKNSNDQNADRSVAGQNVPDTGEGRTYDSCPNE
jgi:pectin methylesterase-like acyl-CoA thioesterase